MANLDSATVEGFGREWAEFDQSALSEAELLRYFENYFRIFPWESLPQGAVGFDVGCGSGRWARFVSPRVGTLHCIDASGDALQVAQRNLATTENCRFHHASVDDMPLTDGSMDFGYSLGVLHHVPDTAAALRSCSQKLKPGAPFLIYMYYALETRPVWFRTLWRASDLFRRVISPLPHRVKVALSLPIALFVYLPLARLARLIECCGVSPKVVPLSAYRRASFYTLRTDALDRFGTRLERRFTADEIRKMMNDAGLGLVKFSDREPFWCAIGTRL